MTSEFRIEHDTMGEVRVPVDALYRAQTQRAVENFPISGSRLERSHIEALARIKKAAARANAELGVLEHLASRVLAPGERASEAELTERVSAFTEDPVRLRRDLVESGLVGRRQDGSAYWRERSTPHDDEEGARPRPADPWP